MATGRQRFKPQAHMHGSVVLNFTRHAKGDLHIYAHAHQQAASKLVDVFRANPYYSDAEACPIVFLYRHAIELYLKAILLWAKGWFTFRRVMRWTWTRCFSVTISSSFFHTYEK